MYFTCGPMKFCNTFANIKTCQCCKKPIPNKNCLVSKLGIDSKIEEFSFLGSGISMYYFLKSSITDVLLVLTIFCAIPFIVMTSLQVKTIPEAARTLYVRFSMGVFFEGSSKATNTE